MSDAEAWKHRFERERTARREAEELLHVKSRDLYEANVELAARAQDLSRSLADLRAAQTALVQREKMAALGDLVAGISHEVNTPLGVALTAVTHGLARVQDLVRDAESGQLTRGRLRAHGAETLEALGLAVQNLERSGALVRSFKQVAVDQASEEMRPVVLAELVADVLNSLRPMVRRARVSVEVEAPTGEPLDIAAGAFAQILTNLVQNACVHAYPAREDAAGAPDARRVRVHAEDLGGALRIAVADDGAGMEASVAARVFDPFFTTRRGSGGSGLGMHIVHNLVVHRFGGSIRVTSTPGAGTTFHLDLPVGTDALRRRRRP
jgi:two-component system NtrC family sensor kinase